jgi:F420-0:gamma-glutamyl ligase-like protein
MYILLGKLIGNLIDEALQRDKIENLRKRPSDQQQLHLDNLVKAILSCGVSFSV